MPARRSLSRPFCASLSLALLGAAPALAQPTDAKALAEQLFEQARAHAKANQWSEACPKFEASLRYDAALGTRLNLATCYEKIGRIASAWGVFRDCADLARAAGDTAKRDYALKQAAALLPRLPKLTISGPMTPPPGFVVMRGDTALDLAALGTALYVDPGPHEITATAPGFQPFRASIRVGEGGAESVVIRELARAKEPPPGEPAPADAPSPVAVVPEAGEEPAPPPSRARKLAGLGALGGGAIVTGVGLIFGLTARGAYDDAQALCGAQLVCESAADFDRGRDLVEQARGRATLSTVFVASGLTVAAAGVVLWLTAPSGERREPRSARRPARDAATAVVPLVTDRAAGLSVLGRF